MEFESSRPCDLLINNFLFFHGIRLWGKVARVGFETMASLFVPGLVPRRQGMCVYIIEKYS